MDKDEIQMMIDAAQASIQEQMQENYKDLYSKMEAIEETIAEQDQELCKEDQRLLDHLDEDVRDMMYLVRSNYKGKYLDGNYAGRD